MTDTVPSPRPETAALRADLQRALDASADAWNAADLGRFMDGYAESPATSYISGDRLAQGLAAIRALYEARFGPGDPAAMGHLALDILDLRPLGAADAATNDAGESAASPPVPHHVYVIGRYRLRRDAAHGGDATGLTTLLFRKMPDGWKILADHSG